MAASGRAGSVPRSEERCAGGRSMVHVAIEAARAFWYLQRIRFPGDGACRLLFRKKRALSFPVDVPAQTLADPGVLQILERLEKAGAQLLVRLEGIDEVYTTEVVGLGRDGFFVDTLSPPGGDRRVRAGALLSVETLYQGISHTFSASVLGRVQFIDELPAFKIAFPAEIRSERRRKSPRLAIQGGASLSFLSPFSCDAPVVNLSEGGLAFEYEADAGRLRTGAVVRDILLELGTHPVVTVQGRIVGNMVAELGGISLPKSYRASLAFQSLDPAALEVIRLYLSEIQGLNVTA
jgi:c-di-GMP-binding flagellar brake protein YcgR